MAGKRINTFLYSLYKRSSKGQSLFRQRCTPFGWVFVGAMGASGVLGMNTNQTVAYQLFSLLAVAGMIEVAASFFMRIEVGCTRDVPAVLTAGVPLEYRLVFNNTSNKPLRGFRLFDYIDVQIPSLQSFLYESEPLEDERNIFDRFFLYYRWLYLMARHQIISSTLGSAQSVGPHDTLIVPMNLVPHRRGVCSLHALRVLVPGPLGLFYKRFCVEAKDPLSTLTILPQRYRVPEITLDGERQYQPRGVSLAAPVGQSEEFIGLREYRPGDQLKQVHWKSWARTGKPVVMEYADEFISRYALIVDTLSTKSTDTDMEEIISLAASFACSLDTQESLLDMLFVEKDAHCITSGRGTTQPEYFLEVLASLTHGSERSFESLEGLIDAHTREIGAAVVVLGEWDQRRKNLIHRLRCNGISLTVMVVGHKERVVPSQIHGEGVFYIDVENVQTEVHKVKSSR